MNCDQMSHPKGAHKFASGKSFLCGAAKVDQMSHPKGAPQVSMRKAFSVVGAAKVIGG